MKPAWITEAESHLGLKEVPGKASNPKILNWLIKLRAWWAEDDTPWCGTFVAHCLQTSNLAYPKAWYRAKAYLDWGIKLEQPIEGCIAIFDREGGGHVGFVVGKDLNNRLLVLGGNQGNQVSIAPFSQSRILGYRWPKEVGYQIKPLPMIVSSDKSSTNEA